jgi:hypothetical protein
MTETILMDDGSVGSTEENKTKENTRKYKINKIGLSDVFCTTGAGMVNAVNTWINKIKEDEQYQKTIRVRKRWLKKFCFLKLRQESQEQLINRSEEEHEVQVKLSLEQYLMDRDGIPIQLLST